MAPHEHDAACLREEQPLVRVERHRVGAVETGEEVPADGVDAAGNAVRAVDVEPHAARLADVGERVDRVDGAGERRARGRDDGDRHEPAARSASIASATASGRSRRCSSSSSERTWSEPIPSSSAARTTE